MYKSQAEHITMDGWRRLSEFSENAAHLWLCVRSPLLMMSLVDERCVLPEPIGWLCLQLDCPLPVAELFPLPPLKSGTLYRSTSSQFPRCSVSGVTWNVFTIAL